MNSTTIGKFSFNSDEHRLRIHNSFRYPAKFHPPVAAALVNRYSQPGETVLDPFCGSGTLLVEAIRAGRHAEGGDVDPLAVFIADSKTRQYAVSELESALDLILQIGRGVQRSDAEHQRLMFEDLTESEFEKQLGGLWVPQIPNLFHWFRRYVVVDLARLKCAIEDVSGSDIGVRSFLNLSFAAIIRNASNADPVPVSGLEVTAHMRRKNEAGRAIDVLQLFRKKAQSIFQAIAEFDATRLGIESKAGVSQRDARTPLNGKIVDSIITSPPYQSAVDYYRRHQLEMFWLGLTRSQSDRLALLPSYVGRANTALSHPDVQSTWRSSSLADEWLEKIGEVSSQRARDFRAYFSAMTSAFNAMATSLKSGGAAVVVVGRSQWGGVAIPTEALFKELVPQALVLHEHLAYPVMNRTMSYTRHNGADIGEEHVLVFKRT